MKNNNIFWCYSWGHFQKQLKICSKKATIQVGNSEIFQKVNDKLSTCSYRSVVKIVLQLSNLLSHFVNTLCDQYDWFHFCVWAKSLMKATFSHRIQNENRKDSCVRWIEPKFAFQWIFYVWLWMLLVRVVSFLKFSVFLSQNLWSSILFALLHWISDIGNT